MFSAKKLTGRFSSPKRNIQTKNSSASSNSSFFSSPKEEERHNQHKKTHEAMKKLMEKERIAFESSVPSFHEAKLALQEKLAAKALVQSTREDQGPSFYFPGDEEAFQEMLEEEQRSAVRP